jgi:phage tail-like protein
MTSASLDARGADTRPPGDRRLLAVRGCDQWVRAAHAGTAVGRSGVGLHWTLPGPAAVPGVGGLATAAVASPPEPGRAARGLAFDRFCRAYLATDGNVQRIRFGDAAHGVDYASVPPPVPLFDPAEVPTSGVFTAVSPPAPPLDDPSGLGVDADDRLVIAERGARRLRFVDLWQRRVIREAATSRPGLPVRGPVGVAVDGRTVWVLTESPAALLRLTARGVIEEVPLPELPAGAVPYRVAVLGDRPVLLVRSVDERTWLVAAGLAPREVGPAADLVAMGELVVVGPAAGRFAVRYAVVGDGWRPVDALDVTGYDGVGLAVSPAGRLVYTTSGGLRLGVGTRLRYTPEGRVVTFALDSGEAGARWGRLFVDACLPSGTDVRVAVRTSDDETPAQIARTSADPALCEPYRPDLSPALPPPTLDLPAEQVDGRLYPRADHPTPWWRYRADDRVLTLEGYPDVPPGRYAWVTLRLIGTTAATPVVRELRIEAQTHTLLRRLPAVYADADGTGFLHRYLALFDGLLHDLDRRSAHRELLVDPVGAPEEALDWLASFVGLLLDGRWPVADRRQLVAEAAWLYRYRGTVLALRRYLQLYLHVTPVLLEHYRLRGLGGALLGDESSRSVLGLGLRVGGEFGQAGTAEPPADAVRRHAHRFTVLVPRSLSAEERSVVELILERERPAHTGYELCTVDAGLRVGVGDHLAVSTIVGRTGGFTPLVLDHAVLGRTATLGRAAPGPVVEASRVGTSRAG